MNIKEENGVFSITERVIAEITNKREEYLQQKIIDYAKQHSEEYGEQVEVMFLDEDIVRMIIKLGIQEYLKKPDEIEILRKALEIAIEDINRLWERSNGKNHYIPLTVQDYIESAIKELDNKIKEK